MDLFFASHVDGSQVVLDSDDARHCVTVMRHKRGDLVWATDGNGMLYKTRLLIASPRQCVLEVIALPEAKPRPYPSIHLAVALLRNHERIEFLLEKATELGVSEITPIVCTRTLRHEAKLSRWQKIIKAAMKQSLSCWLPTLHCVTTLADFVQTKKQPDSKAYIAHCLKPGLPALHHVAGKSPAYILLIGPEGDFTEVEVQQAVAQHFQEVSLHTQRLRTETAALVAVHTLILKNS